MTTHVVTLQLPEHVYLRLQHMAQATQQSFDDVVLRAYGSVLPLVGKTHRPNFRPTSPRSIAWTMTLCGTLHASARPRRRWGGTGPPRENANVTLSTLNGLS